MNFRDLLNVHQHADGVRSLTKIEENCRACSLGKAHRLPFAGHFQQTTSIGEIIHSDIVGPLEASFPNLYRYVATFQDDHSQYVFLVFMCTRDEIRDAYNAVIRKMEALVNGDCPTTFSVRLLHSDGANEYKSLQKYLGEYGMGKSFSPPYTPELNAIAERINRTMVEGARSILIQANLPRCLWIFALKHVIFVRNWVPHSTTGTTPFSLLNGKRPNLKNVRLFGGTAYVLRLPPGSKFEARATEGVYLETM